MELQTVQWRQTAPGYVEMFQGPSFMTESSGLGFLQIKQLCLCPGNENGRNHYTGAIVLTPTNGICSSTPANG